MKIEIPKIIHFIWAGGAFRLPDSNYDTIFKWAITNLNWQINFWVDVQTDPKVMSFYEKEFKKAYKQFLKRYRQDFEIMQGKPSAAGKKKYKISDSLTKKIVDYILQNMSQDNLINRIEICDIGPLRDEYISYEIDKLDPNYGSSSDLLRLEILEAKILNEKGGAYFDMDVLPGENSLDELDEIIESPTNHVFYVDHCSQFPSEIAGEKLKELSLENVGNDSLISTKGNPLVSLILKQCKQNYNQMEDTHRVRCAYSGKNIRDMTIARTGPGVIRSVLASLTPNANGKFEIYQRNNLFFQEILSSIKMTRDGNKSFSEPASMNTGLWMNVSVIRMQVDKALEVVKKTIAFEAKHFGVIRLDDHINDIMVSGQLKKKDLISVKEVIKQYCKDLPPLKNNKKYILQVSGVHKDIFDFANRNGLTTIYNLNSSSCILALQSLLLPSVFEVGEVSQIKDFFKQGNIARIDGFKQKYTSYLEYLYSNILYLEAIIIHFKEFNNYTIPMFYPKLDEILGAYNNFCAKTKQLLGSDLLKTDAQQLDRIEKKIIKLKALLIPVKTHKEQVEDTFEVTKSYKG